MLKKKYEKPLFAMYALCAETLILSSRPRRVLPDDRDTDNPIPIGGSQAAPWSKELPEMS